MLYCIYVWSTVSPFISDKNKRADSKTILQEGEETIVDNLKVANVFNDYFCDVALNIRFDDSITSSCDAIAKHVNHPSVLKIKDMYKISDDSFHFMSVDVSTIDKKLCSIDNKKSQGYDNIPGKLLRLAHSALAPHLTYLVNECLKTSAFPCNMKNAELSLVYKRHDNLDKINYRPVSVLTVVSKLNESVMNDQLGQYSINIFHELLCAFRKKYSCQSTLVKMIEDWKESLDKNNVIGTLFMDLSRAFDSLPHGLLIAKFRAYGLSLSACDLLK